MRASAAAGLTALLVACGTAGNGEGRADASVFEYEPVAFDTVETPGRQVTGELATTNVVFQGPTGPISGRLHRPDPSQAGGPGVLLLHGSGGSADQMDPVAGLLACSGATALAIDAPNAGRREHFVRFTEEDYHEQIALIQNLRHSLDLLIEEQGASKIGFLGISYGAAMGSLLVGVEPRITAAALMVGDGGLVAHFTEGGEPVPEVADQPGIDDWLDRMGPIEPSLFLADATMPVRLVSARHDESIPESDALAWHAAAGETAEVVWVDTDHSMSPQASTDTVRWLGGHLGLDDRAVSACADVG